MDLRLYFRVISRFKFLVLAGLILACVLTFFSVYRVSFAHGLGISHRQGQTFVSEERLFLNTQGGVPYRTTTAKVDPKTGQIYYPANLVPPSNLGSTAVLYSQIVNSDIVQRLVGRLPGTYFAYAVTSGQQQLPQPFLAIDGFASSPNNAVRIANRVSDSFVNYVNENQRVNHVPPAQRVILQVTTKATSATVKSGRHYTLPIIVFLVTLIATLGLAFILENLRPAPSAAEGAGVQPAPRPEPRLAEAVPVAEAEPETEGPDGNGEVAVAKATRSRRASSGQETTRV